MKYPKQYDKLFYSDDSKSEGFQAPPHYSTWLEYRLTEVEFKLERIKSIAQLDPVEGANYKIDKILKLFDK